MYRLCIALDANYFAIRSDPTNLHYESLISASLFVRDFSCPSYEVALNLKQVILYRLPRISIDIYCIVDHQKIFLDPHSQVN